MLYYTSLKLRVSINEKCKGCHRLGENICSISVALESRIYKG